MRVALSFLFSFVLLIGAVTTPSSGQEKEMERELERLESSLAEMAQYRAQLEKKLAAADKRKQQGNIKEIQSELQKSLQRSDVVQAKIAAVRKQLQDDRDVRATEARIKKMEAMVQRQMENEERLAREYTLQKHLVEAEVAIQESEFKLEQLNQKYGKQHPAIKEAVAKLDSWRARRDDIRSAIEAKGESNKVTSRQRKPVRRRDRNRDENRQTENHQHENQAQLEHMERALLHLHEADLHDLAEALEHRLHRHREGHHAEGHRERDLEHAARHERELERREMEERRELEERRDMEAREHAHRQFEQRREMEEREYQQRREMEERSLDDRRQREHDEVERRFETERQEMEKRGEMERRELEQRLEMEHREMERALEADGEQQHIRQEEIREAVQGQLEGVVRELSQAFGNLQTEVQQLRKQVKELEAQLDR